MEHAEGQLGFYLIYAISTNYIYIWTTSGPTGIVCVQHVCAPACSLTHSLSLWTLQALEPRREREREPGGCCLQRAILQTLSNSQRRRILHPWAASNLPPAQELYYVLITNFWTKTQLFFSPNSSNFNFFKIKFSILI